MNSVKLQTWLVAPYKKPYRDLEENEVFNNHVSMVRIRSEHAIGFLKGRFKSLKGLRVKIVDERSHRFATYWVLACIVVHTFAMQCEEEEYSDSDSEDDPFVGEGASSGSDDDQPEAGPSWSSSQRLTAARAFRERLKAELFDARQRRQDFADAALAMDMGEIFV